MNAKEATYRKIIDQIVLIIFFKSFIHIIANE